MKIKKILAAIAATAVAVSTMAVTAFAGQDESALADGTAFLNINKSDWSDFAAEYTNVAVTGDGTYTVSMTASEPVDMGQFNALEIVNGETLYGSTYVVTIDSVKINGEEKKIAEGWTLSADGAGIKTRVNIYNEWNSPDAAGEDQRAADGDIMSKTAMLISADDLAGVTSLEVTFTVSGIGGGDASSEASEPETTSDEPAPAANESAPAAETTEAPATGNVPAAVMLSVMAVAGAAVVASRKRK